MPTKLEYQLLKYKVLDAYGYNCKNCGEADMDVLTVDHINDDAVEHEKKTGVRSGGPLYNWLYKNSFPNGFQILCANCQRRKEVARC